MKVFLVSVDFDDYYRAPIGVYQTQTSAKAAAAEYMNARNQTLGEWAEYRENDLVALVVWDETKPKPDLGEWHHIVEIQQFVVDAEPRRR